MRKAIAVAAVAAATITACSSKSSTSHGSSASTSAAAAASSSAPASSSPPSSAPVGPVGQGVTATTIKVGITYVDLAAIRQIVNLDHGDYQKAYTAVINDINAHGGINGRTIVPVFAPVNPIGTAPAAAACTKLTEDEKVFAVVGFFQADDALCYLETHSTPVITSAGLTPEQQQRAKAPWFADELSPDHVVPKVLDALNRQGFFTGHKVAVVANAADQAQVDGIVVPELKKLNVNVVQTAINDAAANDTQAGYQQYALIAQKFQAQGADTVVAVAGAGDSWPKALQVNHSSYLPRLVATSIDSINAYINDKSGDDPKVMATAVTGSSLPAVATGWNDPAMQKCVALVQAAEPTATINNPVTATPTTPNTWVSPEAACQLMPLFVAIAKAAGATLNNDTFLHGGETVTGLTLPGALGPLSFGPGSHDGGGPVFLGHWDPATRKLAIDGAPA